MPPNQSTQLKYDSNDPFIWNKKEILKTFTAAADTFVKKENGTYHIWAASRDWFLEEWGRDTFIALPGILLATGRYKEAKNLMQNFAKYERNGLIPNRIVSPNEILYNTVDGSIWFIQSIKSYLKYTDDWKFVKKMLPLMHRILEAYCNGTGYERFGAFQEIKMDEEDGLIMSPAQATWMDADSAGDGSTIVTPRNGKCVEINALWYANLKFVAKAELHFNSTSKKAKEYNVLARKVKKSFRIKFWNDAEKCLYDVIKGDPHQGAIRPNMLIAVSHGEDLLTKEQQIGVFNAATNDLLTPGGMRTLSPRDSYYKGVYDTHLPPSKKDWAYHQGTVWPWLIGPYCDALVKVRKYEKKTKKEIQEELKQILTPLVRFCSESEYKSLPEVFSGDEPHDPGGTTSQAWSVGEVLRVMVEYGVV